jgi:hypothetical protein
MSVLSFSAVLLHKNAVETAESAKCT